MRADSKNVSKVESVLLLIQGGLQIEEFLYMKVEVDRNLEVERRTEDNSRYGQALGIGCGLTQEASCKNDQN
jgi:hypothetical protein